MKKESRPLLPRYGIVRWRDAAGVQKHKVPLSRKHLPLRESVGALFISVDGTLAIVHEYDPEALGRLQRGAEITIAPLAWAETVTELTPGAPTPPPQQSPDDEKKEQ